MKLFGKVTIRKLSEQFAGLGVVGAGTRILGFVIPKPDGFLVNFDVCPPIRVPFVKTDTFVDGRSFLFRLSHVLMVLDAVRYAKVSPPVMETVVIPMVNMNFRISYAHNDAMHHKVARLYFSSAVNGTSSNKSVPLESVDSLKILVVNNRNEAFCKRNFIHNPFSIPRLSDLSRGGRMTRTIEKRLSKCRTKLLLDSPWFGSLSMRLRLESCDTIPTFATDGTRILYNPIFAASLPDEQIVAVIAHEVMHCALLHMYRRGHREPFLSNVAQDYAINIELQKSGFKLPDGCLIDAKYDGQSFEAIYAKLLKNAKKITVSLGPTGECRDAQSGDKEGKGGSASVQMSERDWQIAAQSAANTCKGIGKMPAHFEEMIAAARKPVADWREILREFIEATTPSDYSWTNPNRRHVANGLYLPGIVRENTGHIAVAIDTSGSIDTNLLRAFCTEVNEIVQEAKPERISVLYADCAVHKVETYGQDEEITMRAVGRGGTAFQPTFDAVAKWEEPPVCLIYFTDLQSSDTPTEPPYPVLWAVSESETGTGVFGRTVRVSEGR
jgi:predicted metal-dependent peptidase